MTKLEADPVLQFPQSRWVISARPMTRLTRSSPLRYQARRHPPGVAPVSRPPTWLEGVCTPTAHEGAPGRDDGTGSPPGAEAGPGCGSTAYNWHNCVMSVACCLTPVYFQCRPRRTRCSPSEHMKNSTGWICVLASKNMFRRVLEQVMKCFRTASWWYQTSLQVACSATGQRLGTQPTNKLVCRPRFAE